MKEMNLSLKGGVRTGGDCGSVSVFDDGDEKTLRRTSLCLKGERHFAESEVSLSVLRPSVLPPRLRVRGH